MHVRCSIVVSISACHVEDPGSIPGGGVVVCPFASVSAQSVSEHTSSCRLIPLTCHCPCKSVQCKLCLVFCVPSSDHIDIAGMAHCTVLQDDLRLSARSGCQSGVSKYHFARTCWQHALLRDVCSFLGACDLARTTATPIDQGQLQVVYQATDTVSERLRRWTRNPLGSARRGSNPLGVDFLYWRLCMQVYLTAAMEVQ